MTIDQEQKWDEPLIFRNKEEDGNLVVSVEDEDKDELFKIYPQGDSVTTEIENGGEYGSDLYVKVELDGKGVPADPMFRPPHTKYRTSTLTITSSSSENIYKGKLFCIDNYNWELHFVAYQAKDNEDKNYDQEEEEEEEEEELDAGAEDDDEEGEEEEEEEEEEDEEDEEDEEEGGNEEEPNSETNLEKVYIVYKFDLRVDGSTNDCTVYTMGSQDGGIVGVPLFNYKYRPISTFDGKIKFETGVGGLLMRILVATMAYFRYSTYGTRVTIFGENPNDYKPEKYQKQKEVLDKSVSDLKDSFKDLFGSFKKN